MKRLVFFAAAVFAFAVSADELMFSCDFSSDLRMWETNAYRGSFKGVLPRGLAPDHIARCEGRGFTELRKEDGMGYLRFKSVREGTRFIFSGKSFPVLTPGFYRLVVKGRAVTDPLRAELKTVKWIGTWYGSTKISMPEWETKEHVIRIAKTVEVPTAIALAFSTGEADVASVALYRTDEKDYAAKFRRPPKGTGNLFTRRHFAFALPNGWSWGCESRRGRTEIEGTALVLDAGEKGFFWSAPFQPSDPSTNCTVRFRYRSDRPWRVEVVDYENRCAAVKTFLPSASMKEAALVFRPEPYVDAYSLRFTGAGTLRLDDIEAYSGIEAPPRAADDVCEVHLAPDGGEIAAVNNIQFADEQPLAKWKVFGMPDGAQVKVKVTDVYGGEYQLEVKGASSEGSFLWNPPTAAKLGAFLVSAWVEKDGRRISPVEEMSVTRLMRPATWGRDAPDSYFGAHFLAHEDVCTAMKAAGINWARFHDACTALSGWYAIEPEKGNWKWPDEEIRVFRDNHIRIFAQLGTTPKWASHFYEMKRPGFGYFERYLRPTNTCDWVNYVTNYVSHYKGVISDYFVWNEPWYLWWADGLDQKYYNRRKAGEDFGRLMLAAYKGVKAADPSATVCGFCTYADGGRWVNEVMQGGGYEACDQMDFHFYASQPRCRKGRDLNLTQEAFGTVYKRHQDCRKPIYHTEGGAATYGRLSGLYCATVPWKPDSKQDIVRTSDEIVRLCVSLLAEGITRVFHYTQHSLKALGVKSPYLKLQMPDGKPHPALASHSFMALLLDEAKCERVEDYGKDGLVYSFLRKDGRKVKVYSGLSESETFSLLKAKKAKIYDIFGNALTRETYLPGTLIYSL